MADYTFNVWVRRIVDALTFHGLDVDRLLAEAGIDRLALARADGRTPNVKVARLWCLAAERSGNPHIAVAARAGFRPSGFDAVGYAMMSCPNLLEAFRRAIRYLKILTEVIDVELLEDERHYRIEFRDFEPSADTRPRIEFVFSALIEFCRWVSGRPFDPAGVEFPFRPPENPDVYAAAFGCSPRFGAAVSALRFAREDLHRPLVTANPELTVILDRFAQAYMRRFATTQITEQVRAYILWRLPEDEPRRDLAAASLGMSERTLHRRLANEGASFSALLDATRRGLAERYLRELNLPLVEIAWLLGFSDQRSFFRACRRWFDASPNTVRAKGAAN